MTDSPLEIREVPGKGRGVFATQPIERGALIERTAVLAMPESELELVRQTQLSDYLFAWPLSDEIGEAIAFGRISLANHADVPNTEYRRHLNQGLMDWVALRPIAAGEELTIRYACPLWFPAV